MSSNIAIKIEFIVIENAPGDNPEKFKAARKYCEQHNLKFKVITEKELKIK